MTRLTDFYGWKLLAVFWVIIFTAFSFPLFGAASVVNPVMAKDLHLDRSALGLAYGLFQWMVGLPAPLVAICINKKGVRFTVTLGCLIILAGSLLMVFVVRSSWQVDVVFSGVIGFGALCAGVLGAQSCIGQWFVKRKARAITLVHTGSAIGGFVAAPLLTFVIGRFGGNWRAGWWVIAGLSLFAAVLAIVFIKEKPADLGQVPDGEVIAAQSSAAASAPAKVVYKAAEDWTFGAAFRRPAIWLIIFASLGISAGYPLFIAQGVDHLRDLGYSAPQAAFSISVMLISALAGQLIVIVWGDVIEPRLIWAAASVVFGVGMMLALNASGTVGLYLYAICLGVGFGASFACLMTLPANYFGAKAYASILGVLIAVGTTAGFAGPYLAGIVYDRYSSYAYAFYSVAGLCFLAAIALLFATPPLRRAAQSLAAALG